MRVFEDEDEERFLEFESRDDLEGSRRTLSRPTTSLIATIYIQWNPNEGDVSPAPRRGDFYTDACNERILMKTGFVKEEGKSYAYIEFENVKEIDKFFDEIEERASPRRPSY